CERVDGQGLVEDGVEESDRTLGKRRESPAEDWKHDTVGDLVVLQGSLDVAVVVDLLLALAQQRHSLYRAEQLRKSAPGDQFAGRKHKSLSERDAHLPLLQQPLCGLVLLLDLCPLFWGRSRPSLLHRLNLHDRLGLRGRLIGGECQHSGGVLLEYLL